MPPIKLQGIESKGDAIIRNLPINIGSLNLHCFLDDKDAKIAEVQSCVHLVSCHFLPGSLQRALHKASQ